MSPARGQSLSPWRRAFGAWERALDAISVLVLIVELWRWMHHHNTGISFALTAATCVCVAYRRRSPVASMTGAVATSVGVTLVDGDALGTWILAQVCLSSVALRRPLSEALAAAGALAAALYASALAVMGLGPLDPTALALVLWSAAVAGAGLTVRSQGDFVAAMEARALAAEAARESEVERRVTDERLRIARDLHDAVAHTIAVVNVHVGAAEVQLERDPDRAKRSMAEVRRASGRVLVEMREILSVLRAGDDGATTMPSAQGLRSLIEVVRLSGVQVDFIEETVDGLDPAVDAALYRVLQEALTNVRKHGTGWARVRLTVSAEQVALTVENGVSTLDHQDQRSGFGLVGIRERVQHAGGQVEIADDGRTFRLSVAFPLSRDVDETA